jgi:DNA-directed RNA polymerase specialized sigma24 family protein
MKNRVARAAAEAVARGRTRLSPWAVWSRWFPAARAVDPEAFQDSEEPYPRHWRTPPADLPAQVTAADLDAALEELPETWRRVLAARFRGGRPPEAVAADLGLSVREEQQIANRALAEVRRRLAHPEDRR